MSKTCDFFLEKGSEFLATVHLVGVNNQDLPVEDCRFFCFAQNLMNEKENIKIECLTERAYQGEIVLYMPACETIKLSSGIWEYNLDMVFEENRRIRILLGHLNVMEDIKR